MRQLLFLMSVCFSQTLFAHGMVHDQIDKLTHLITHEPNVAEHYTKRGRLSMEEQHWDESKTDFYKALQLDNNQRVSHYFLGQVLLEQKQFLRAEQHTQQFINAVRQDENGALMRGYRLLGKIYAKQHSPQQSIKAYRKALASTRQPGPAQYLELAQIYTYAGNRYHKDALAILDDGIKRMGPLSVLQDKAIEIELLEKNYDAALARFQTLIAQGQRLPVLYHNRGQALLKARMPVEAKQSFEIALQLINALPEYRRTIQANKSLQQALRSEIAKL